MEKTRGNGYKLHWMEFRLSIREIFIYLFFNSENNYSLVQPPQEHDRVPTAAGFQDVVGQCAR